MIQIDGHHSGGQTLRSSLSLSVLTGKPFKIVNIRGQRGEGGLKHQHLAAVKAMQELCTAEVRGAELGSMELEFRPKNIIKDNLTINIGTAGSTTLILQTIIPALIHHNKQFKINVKGGTDTTHCPMSFYFMHIYCDFLRRININFSFDIRQFGFFPKGGGELFFEFDNAKLSSEINFLDRGKLSKIDVHSLASNQLKDKKVAERIIEGFKKTISPNIAANYKTYYIDSLNPGGFIHAHAHYENYKVGDGVLCELYKKSEDIGKECADKIRALMNSEGLDKYMADQIMIFMAIAGRGKIMASEITDHIKTNAYAIESFLPVKFKIENNFIECGPVV